jgi:TRAP-type C4-dicarboxylate transport system permease small subunit
MKWAPVRDLVLSIACVGVCAVMFKVCVAYIALEKTYGGSMFLGIPNWVGQIILPFGFGSLCFRFVIKAVNTSFELRKTNLR